MDTFSYIERKCLGEPKHSIGGIGLEEKYQTTRPAGSFSIDYNGYIQKGRVYRKGDTIVGRQTQVQYRKPTGGWMFDWAIQFADNKYIWKRDLVKIGSSSFNGGDRLTGIVGGSFYSASGNVPPFKVGEKDPVTGKGSEGNIGDLQRALNKLGAKPALTDDGIFGSKTKDAIKALGYSYSLTSGLSSSEFYKILGDANKGDAAAAEELSLTDMKKIWEKDKGKYGKLSSSPDFDKWLKRQKTLAGIKDFGKGFFQVGLTWLQNRQGGVPTPDSDEDLSKEASKGRKEIWGMPAGVVYAGGAVLGIGLIIGIVALATRKPQQVVVQSIPAV